MEVVSGESRRDRIRWQDSPNRGTIFSELIGPTPKKFMSLVGHRDFTNKVKKKKLPRNQLKEILGPRHYHTVSLSYRRGQRHCSNSDKADLGQEKFPLCIRIRPKLIHMKLLLGEKGCVTININGSQEDRCDSSLCN